VSGRNYKREAEKEREWKREKEQMMKVAKRG